MERFHEDKHDTKQLKPKNGHFFTRVFLSFFLRLFYSPSLHVPKLKWANLTLRDSRQIRNLYLHVKEVMTGNEGQGQGDGSLPLERKQTRSGDGETSIFNLICFPFSLISSNPN